MVDSPCNFCSGDPNNCRDMGRCDIYNSVVVCSNCGAIIYKEALLDKKSCPDCKKSVLKTYCVEVSGRIKVDAFNEDDAHNKAREEIDKFELDILYCEEV